MILLIAGVLLVLLVLHVILHPIRSLGCAVEVIVAFVLFSVAFGLIAHLLVHR